MLDNDDNAACVRACVQGSKEKKQWCEREQVDLWIFHSINQLGCYVSGLFHGPVKRL